MSTAIICEIHATGSTVGDLERIARFCADEIGQSMDVLTREVGGGDALITLHVSAEQAASQHPVWCLACRLACFCPNARVSIFVRAETKFAGVAALRPGMRRRKLPCPAHQSAA